VAAPARAHPNGVRNISEFVIVAQDPALSAQVYSHLFGSGTCADRAGSCATITNSLILRTPFGCACHAGCHTAWIWMAIPPPAFTGRLPCPMAR
jgi:hypothetical protein